MDTAGSISGCNHSAGQVATADRLRLSVVIVTYRRIDALASCLQSVMTPDLPEDAQVIVACNGPDPASQEFLAAFAIRDKRLEVVVLDAQSPAGARNAALRRVRGDVIHFLDDDVTVEPGLFARALRTFAAQPEIGVIGGPNLTPRESSRFQRCVGQVLESPLGSATVRYRYHRGGEVRRADDRSLILCNLAIRRSELSKLNSAFQESVICNEENILLYELAALGTGMLHDPGLAVYHRRRSDLAAFCRQVFRYGQGRWQNTVAWPRSLSPVFLIPALFLFYLVTLAFVRTTTYLMPLAAYLALVLGFSIIEAVRARDVTTVPLFMVLFPACHGSYGAGFLRQLGESSLRALASRLTLLRSSSRNHASRIELGQSYSSSADRREGMNTGLIRESSPPTGEERGSAINP